MGKGNCFDVLMVNGSKFVKLVKEQKEFKEQKGVLVVVCNEGKIIGDCIEMVVVEFILVVLFVL